MRGRRGRLRTAARLARVLRGATELRAAAHRPASSGSSRRCARPRARDALAERLGLARRSRRGAGCAPRTPTACCALEGERFALAPFARWLLDAPGGRVAARRPRPGGALLAAAPRRAARADEGRRAPALGLGRGGAPHGRALAAARAARAARARAACPASRARAASSTSAAARATYLAGFLLALSRRARRRHRARPGRRRGGAAHAARGAGHAARRDRVGDFLTHGRCRAEGFDLALLNQTSTTSRPPSAPRSSAASRERLAPGGVRRDPDRGRRPGSPLAPARARQRAPRSSTSSCAATATSTASPIRRRSRPRSATRASPGSARCRWCRAAPRASSGVAGGERWETCGSDC